MVKRTGIQVAKETSLFIAIQELQSVLNIVFFTFLSSRHMDSSSVGFPIRIDIFCKARTA